MFFFNRKYMAKVQPDVNLGVGYIHPSIIYQTLWMDGWIYHAGLQKCGAVPVLVWNEVQQLPYSFKCASSSWYNIALGAGRQPVKSTILSCTSLYNSLCPLSSTIHPLNSRSIYMWNLVDSQRRAHSVAFTFLNLSHQSIYLSMFHKTQIILFSLFDLLV